jgi:LysR family glycine cleavage system transcriptional activator
VELTTGGAELMRVVEPWLHRLDTGVRHIRHSLGRRTVQLNTFPSFASLWLLPQMEALQRDNPDQDIRVSATDRLIELDDPDFDIVLRYCSPSAVPPGARRMFGEVLTPVIGARLADRIRAGDAPPLARPEDLAQHTLTEEDDHRPSARYLSWRHWLETQGLRQLQPRRWLYLNFTYQQVQAALAGQGVALARIAMVVEPLARGDLIEPFGPEGRITSPYAYWLIKTDTGRAREEVVQFCDWLESRAQSTRAAIGDVDASDAPA